MRTARYLAGRCLQYVLVLLVAVALGFAIPRLAPGDPIIGLVGESGPLLPVEEQRAIIDRAGLDDPIVVQFLTYLSNLARGDLGYSYSKGRPVGEAIGERVPLTLMLVVPAALLSLLVGTALGIRAAWRRGTRTDVGLIAAVLTVEAMPVFFLATLLLLAFAVHLPVLPVSSAFPFDIGRAGIGAHIGEVVRRLCLPCLTLTLAGLGPYFLLTRSSMISTLGEDFILMARAKGCPTRRVVHGHALRNAILPVATIFSLNLGFLLSGAVLVETVFSFPGLGRLAYDAVLARDFPMLQGTFLIATAGIVAANFLSDLAYPFLDPRVRLER